MNWDNPVNGSSIESGDRATGEVAFAPITPRLGQARSIFLSPRDEDGNLKSRFLSFVYDLPSDGRVIVDESYEASTDAQFLSGLHEFVDSIKGPGSFGHGEILDVRNGKKALLTVTDAGVAALRWKEGSVSLLVAGPTLSRESALALAERI